MMDLAQLRAMWAAENPAKLAAAQATGSVGWLVRADGTELEIVSINGAEALAVSAPIASGSPE